LSFCDGSSIREVFGVVLEAFAILAVALALLASWSVR
jgi:hypothetical protein